MLPLLQMFIAMLAHRLGQSYQAKGLNTIENAYPRGKQGLTVLMAMKR